MVPPTPTALQVKSAFGARYFGLDACMAHLMRPGMYGAYHAISVPARESDKQCVSAHVVGTLCENNDWFAKVHCDTLSPRLALSRTQLSLWMLCRAYAASFSSQA